AECRAHQVRGGLLARRGLLLLGGAGWGIRRVAHADPGVAGIRSGMRSRGGMGDPPRTTTIERKRSSTFAAASTSTAAAPPITPRRNQRGPSTPTKRAMRFPAWPPRSEERRVGKECRAQWWSKNTRRKDTLHSATR